MLRAFLRHLFELLLRVFFRRIEISGAAPTGAVVYAANHPNALVDPLFFFCLAPQQVSFLAKAPLFRMPVLSWFVRAMNCLPVYRKVDGADTAKNRETIERARDALTAGGAIAIFPEGTSHSAPQLKPIRSGAARIALGARGLGADVEIVPAGLFYTNKGIFRSDVLLSFGEPIPVPVSELDENGEPPAELIAELTDTIRERLNALTIQADTRDALDLVAVAERVMNADEHELPLDRQLAVRQRLAEGYARLREIAPERLARTVDLVRRYTALLEDLGLPADHASADDFTAGRVLRYALRNLVTLLLLAPAGLLGMLIHIPAYQLVRLAAMQVPPENQDQRATVKLLASMLLFPATWAAIAWGGGHWFGTIGAVTSAAVAPVSAWLALLFKEQVERVGLATRGFGVFLTRRQHSLRLTAKRRRIRQELAELAELL